MADIAPLGGGPGLMAFLCTECGATESTLVYPVNRTRKVDHECEQLEESVEFRIMPSGEGHWYWEVITGGHSVIMRGVADNEPAACQEASDAARKAIQ